MKVRIPINERMASKMASEHKELKGYVEETRTVFVDENGIPVFEKVERNNPFCEGGYGLVSYFGFVTVKESA